MIAEDHSKLVDKIFLKIFLKETTFAQTTYCTYACIRMCAGTSAHMSVLRVSFTRAILWKLESLVSRVHSFSQAFALCSDALYLSATSCASFLHGQKREKWVRVSPSQSQHHQIDFCAYIMICACTYIRLARMRVG